MAVETITIGTLVSRIKAKIKNSTSTDTFLDAEIKFAISWTIRDILSKVELPAYRTLTTKNLTSAGGATYDLPDDFWRIIEPGVRYTSSPYYTLKYIDLQQYDAANGAAIFQSTQRPMYYTIIGRDATSGVHQIRFFAAPDANYTVQVHYYAHSTDHSASADGTNLDVRFPRMHVQTIVWGALTLFPNYLGPDELAIYQAKYVEGIQDIGRTSTVVEGSSIQKQRFRVSSGGRAGIDPWPNSLSGTDLTT